MFSMKHPLNMMSVKLYYEAVGRNNTLFHPIGLTFICYLINYSVAPSSADKGYYDLQLHCDVWLLKSNRICIGSNSAMNIQSSFSSVYSNIISS